MTGPICQPGPNDAFLSRDQGKRSPASSRPTPVPCREGRNCQAMETSPPSFPVISTGTSLLAEKSRREGRERKCPGCPARRISPVGGGGVEKGVRVWTGERFPAASSVHTRRYTRRPPEGRGRLRKRTAVPGWGRSRYKAVHIP